MKINSRALAMSKILDSPSFVCFGTMKKRVDSRVGRRCGNLRQRVVPTARPWTGGLSAQVQVKNSRRATRDESDSHPVRLSLLHEHLHPNKAKVVVSFCDKHDLLSYYKSTRTPSSGRSLHHPLLWLSLFLEDEPLAPEKQAEQGNTNHQPRRTRFCICFAVALLLTTCIVLVWGLNLNDACSVYGSKSPTT